MLAAAKAACDGLLNLVAGNTVPIAREVLRYVAETRLFAIPEVLAPFAVPDDPSEDDGALGGDKEDLKTELGEWRHALEAPIDEIERYGRYVLGESSFDTHQGVKGLEFPRVMVVVSD